MRYKYMFIFSKFQSEISTKINYDSYPDVDITMLFNKTKVIFIERWNKFAFFVISFSEDELVYI